MWQRALPAFVKSRFFAVFDRRFFLLLHHGKTEIADLFAKLKVFAVGERRKLCPIDAESSVFIEEFIVEADSHDVGHEHIVRAERDHVRNLAVDGHGCLRDGRAGEALDVGRDLGGESHHLEFVHLSTRSHAAEVSGFCEAFARQIDDKFTAFFDECVGVTLGAHGDIGLGRMGAENARPPDGDDVRFAVCPHAGDHGRGDGRDECAAFPSNLCHKINLSMLIFFTGCDIIDTYSIT